MQASIVARLRKRVPPAEAVAVAIAAVDSEAYRTCASAYSDLHDQLRLECLAALAVLMEVGAAEAIILINHLGGQGAVTDLVGSAVPPVVEAADQEEVADVVREEIAGILKAALADPGKVSKGRELLLEARAATRKVNRMGFRRGDHSDPEMLAALQSGATVVTEVIHELERLTARLAQKLQLADVATDQTNFYTTFQKLYLAKT